MVYTDVFLGYFDLMEKKLWRDLARSGAWFHLARFRFLPTRKAQLHTHDFPEIFWIESGQAMHAINGEGKRLDSGDLIFIRPSDRHVLAPRDREGFTLVNLAFDPKALSDLMVRHRKEMALFHDDSAALPVRRLLSVAQMKLLTGEINPLSKATHRRLALERFLLGLYAMLLPGSNARTGNMPDWLAQACERIQDVAYFSEGAAGLVRAAGRSPEHVARVVRAQFGCTPSDYVNRVRMEHAERELRLSSTAITDIALECGIQDLAHFYALFRTAYGQPPRRYRLSCQLLSEAER